MRLVALFAIVAVAELAVFMAVESQIGLLNALAIALTTAVIGSVLVRRAGLAVLAEMRRKMAMGELPGRELVHGACILVAGALLISPGFLTDGIGFLLLLPWTRNLVYRVVSRRFRDRMTVIQTGPMSPGGFPGGEVIDVESWEDVTGR